MPEAENTASRVDASLAAPPLSWRRDGFAAVGVAVASVVIAGIALSLWRMNLRIPLVHEGDSAYMLMAIKMLTGSSWLGLNEQIGYPAGSPLYDHTVLFSDVTQFAIVKGMTLVSSDPALVMNVFFLATFPLVAVVTYAVLRILRFDRGVSAVGALVFALLPYHFQRGQVHLMYSAYYAVPVGGLLALGVLGHIRLIARRPGVAGWRGWLTKTTLFTLAAAVFVGLSDIYTAAFTLVAVGCAGVLRGLVGKRSALIVAACLGVVIVGSAAAAQASTIAFHLQNGPSTVGQRLPVESELYALRLAVLLLPQPGERIPALDSIARRYYENTAISGEGASGTQGLLLTVALLVALLVAFASAAGRSVEARLWAVTRDSGALILALFLFATLGGLSMLIATYLSPQLRAWNRVTVMLSFFSVVALAALLTSAYTRWSARARGPLIPAMCGVFVVVFAGWQQTTPLNVPSYAATAASWRSDARFVRDVEAMLPRGAPVLQLPYVPFPEHPPVGGMSDYSHFKGVIHSQRLRWSYGAMRGRTKDDWAAATSTMPLDELVVAAANAGFQGVYVDTAGYAGTGLDIVRVLTQATGAPPIVASEDGRLAFFSFGALNDRLSRVSMSIKQAARRALLSPVTTTFGPGFYPLDRDGQGSSWRWMTTKASLTMENTSDRPRPIELRVAVGSSGVGRWGLTITGAGMTPRSVKANGTRSQVVRRTFIVRPGVTQLDLSADAPDVVRDGRDLRLRLIDPAVRDTRVVTLHRAVAGQRAPR